MKNSNKSKIHQIQQQRQKNQKKVEEINNYVMAGLYNKAIVEATKALDSGALDLQATVPVLVARAVSYSSTKNNEKSLNDYLTLINLIDANPNEKVMFCGVYDFWCSNAAKLFLDKSDTVRAEEYLNKVSKNGRQHPAYFDNLSCLFLRQEKYSKVVETAQKAIELDPKKITNYYNKGLALFNIGDYE
jgi:tetratricopeptide (TPR) repeat protein